MSHTGVPGKNFLIGVLLLRNWFYVYLATKSSVWSSFIVLDQSGFILYLDAKCYKCSFCFHSLVLK